MKKNNMKLSALVLTSVLSLSLLTACTQNAGTAAAPSLAPESPANSVGTVLLSVNPEIEMDYDDDGNVVALTGRNADGQAVLQGYSGYEGQACTAVVAQLVEKIDQGGYFDATIDGHEKNIVLKMARGSQTPDDDFLEDLAEAVRVVVKEDQIGSQTLALDDDDYDDVYGDQGYINAAAAQSIISAQMGRDDLQFVEKEYDLDDGDYEVEFVMDGVEYEYEVNAVTGKVTEMDVDVQNDDVNDRNDDTDDLYDDYDDVNDRNDDADDVYDDYDDVDDRNDDTDDLYDDYDDVDDRNDDTDDLYDDYDDVDDRNDDADDIYDDHDDDDDNDDDNDDNDDDGDDDWDD